MKVIEKRYFVCEICGKTSQNEARVTECARNHYRVTENAQIEEQFTKGGAFPRALDVIFSDGSRGHYALMDLIRATPKEEGARA